MLKLGVAGFVGIPGRFPSDRVAGFDRNGWPLSSEYALSNIYLHYVLDVWFEKRFARSCQGKAFLVRFADDFVACFEWEADARRFRLELTDRLSAFDLEVEPSKTAVLRFGNEAQRHARQDGRASPEVFHFLGFTHFVTRSRRGRFAVGRRTQGKRFCSKLKALDERLQVLRSAGGNAMVDYVRQHLEGHIQYYGVSGNARRVTSYIYFASRLLFKWLNRRSQSRSLTWEQFGETVGRRLPRGRILHNLYPVPPWRTQAGSRMV